MWEVRHIFKEPKNDGVFETIDTVDLPLECWGHEMEEKLYEMDIIQGLDHYHFSYDSTGKTFFFIGNGFLYDDFIVQWVDEKGCDNAKCDCGK